MTEEATSMADSLDVDRLERAVKALYRDIAEKPDEESHFEFGRAHAETFGYPSGELDRIPEAAVESFAGSGYPFDHADIEAGDAVLDLGSGSGTDVFVAALHVGDSGHVTGLDMTEEQLEKARTLRDEAGLDNVSFEHGYIEDIPFDDGTFDAVISNGVINLSPEKEQVFEEAHRVLTAGGRLAISDIISEKPLPESIQNDEDLWASCIGGAEQIDRYKTLIENSGFEVLDISENPPLPFTADAAVDACQKYGVKSISLGAQKD